MGPSGWGGHPAMRRAPAPRGPPGPRARWVAISESAGRGVLIRAGSCCPGSALVRKAGRVTSPRADGADTVAAPCRLRDPVQPHATRTRPRDPREPGWLLRGPWLLRAPCSRRSGSSGERRRGQGEGSCCFRGVPPRHATGPRRLRWRSVGRVSSRPGGRADNEQGRFRPGPAPGRRIPDPVHQAGVTAAGALRPT